MPGPNKKAGIFEDNKLNDIQFDDAELTQDEEEEAEVEEDGSDIDMYEEDDSYFSDDENEESTEDADEIDDNDEEESDDNSIADDYGVSVDAADLGMSSGSEEDEYEIIDVEQSFISPSGELVVQDVRALGDNFRLEYIDIEKIGVTKRIRKSHNVEDLLKSIQSTGLLMPVVVTPTATEGFYVLINGFRRILACARSGIKKIPCIVNTKCTTMEIPILESMYNHSKAYSMKEMVEYIEYLEKEKHILSASMIEYLLQMESGDYTKLKDILNDNDDDIVSKMMSGMLTIGQAFKKLEQRRKNESREEKDIKKAEKVYQQAEESGAEQIEGSGETAEDGASGLTDEEIKSLAVSAGDLEAGLDDKSLEEMVEEGNNIEGFKPHKQTPGEREILDPALSKAVKERDGNTCQCCKEGGMEYVDCNDVHHIVEVYLGGNDAIENLILVCVKCHRLIHLHARGELHMRPFDEMDEAEREKFKRIVKLGNIIRKGLAMKGMKKEELKKHDKLSTIGRTKPGTGQVAG